MTPFEFVRATNHRDAIEHLRGRQAAKYLGRGTNLVDLMREDIERPATLVDVTQCSNEIEERPSGALMIGACSRYQGNLAGRAGVHTEPGSEKNK